MELQSEDGSLVELAEGVEKELGRGPGFAPHDRTVSRRQVRLKVQPTAASEDRFHFNVLIDVIGPNPICIIHSNDGSKSTDEVEIAKSGTQTLLRTGDRFSLSIQEPVFYTLQEPGARVTLGSHVSGDTRPQRIENINGRKIAGHKESDANDQCDGGVRVEEADHLKADSRRVGITTDADEEEGIAEAVARWQRRKQELMEIDQRRSTQAGTVLKEDKDRIGEQAIVEEKLTKDISQLEPVHSKTLSRDPLETNEPELFDRGRPSEDDTDLAKKFGFVVEGCEFERYGKMAHDTSNWVWQIGRRQVNYSDDDEDGYGGDQDYKQHRLITTGSESKQKAKPGNDDDEEDDDWRGDDEGEIKLLSSGEKVVSRKRGVQTRLRDVATTSEARSDSKKKRKVSSKTLAAASTSSQKDFKRKPRASEEEDDEEDGDKDLDDFVVEDADDEDEVEDDEDEWTDEDEDEDGEIEELDDLDEVKSGPVKNKSNQVSVKPMCKYGSKCFRKNKDHLDQFRH
ncbi:uncharacterized protein [Physcomitrium patens]|uniref:PBZ-type domain-containing protein n=1 Tax=Physcomitrium patens TaxID=3218 RepID=A0A7I4AQQ8_PHYPA|nr:protein bfr2-like isoform X2 [Physcomitrium patens]|eukprot:XP_024394220.1 protein bfr2-like isoform X2 [Physcomitrella patens]